MSGADRAAPRAGLPVAAAPTQRGVLAQLPPITAEQLREAQNIKIEPERYLDALRDWVARGEPPTTRCPRSRWSRGRPARHGPVPGRGLVRARPAPAATGRPNDAARWFKEAHRLQPENWTYKRQAWSLADPLQGPNDTYDSDWLTEVRKLGAENYYPPVRL